MKWSFMNDEIFLSQTIAKSTYNRICKMFRSNEKIGFSAVPS